MAERLDRALLEERRMLMNDGFAALLDAYLDDSERRMGEIGDALESGDLERLRRAAHALKGSAANVGAEALAVLCEELEDAAEATGLDALGPLVDRVRAELRDVRDAVVAEQQKH
ncbi:MAG TPA: Hpt domain-containing protein [Pseudomonadales bacterium]